LRDARFEQLSLDLAVLPRTRASESTPGQTRIPATELNDPHPGSPDLTLPFFSFEDFSLLPLPLLHGSITSSTPPDGDSEADARFPTRVPGFFFFYANVSATFVPGATLLGHGEEEVFPPQVAALFSSQELRLIPQRERRGSGKEPPEGTSPVPV